MIITGMSCHSVHTASQLQCWRWSDCSQRRANSKFGLCGVWRGGGVSGFMNVTVNNKFEYAPNQGYDTIAHRYPMVCVPFTDC